MGRIALTSDLEETNETGAELTENAQPRAAHKSAHAAKNKKRRKKKPLKRKTTTTKKPAASAGGTLVVSKSCKERPAGYLFRFMVVSSTSGLSTRLLVQHG